MLKFVLEKSHLWYKSGMPNRESDTKEKIREQWKLESLATNDNYDNSDEQAIIFNNTEVLAH